MVKGSKHTEETKIKMSVNNVGMSGKRHSEESKLKMSRSNHRLCGDKNYMYGKRGKDTPNWNPNKTDEERLDNRSYIEYNEWRKLVFERDNYTCQKCGDNKGGNLEAHHIESYTNNKELRTVAENGITFCISCHKKFHRMYGKKDNTKKINEFLQEL